jgi:hypothetical protein
MRTEIAFGRITAAASKRLHVLMHVTEEKLLIRMDYCAMRLP